jgi:hypothetical protein
MMNSQNGKEEIFKMTKEKVTFSKLHLHFNLPVSEQQL